MLLSPVLAVNIRSDNSMASPDGGLFRFDRFVVFSSLKDLKIRPVQSTAF